MAIATILPPLPPANFALVHKSGEPTLPFQQYLAQLDVILRAIAAGSLGTLTNAANDAAAQAAGVAVNGLYRSGNVVMVRLV